MKSKYTANERLKLIEAYKSSGKTISLFAEENNINKNTFASWISLCKQQTATAAESEVNFIEVRTSVLNQREQTMKIKKGDLEIIIPLTTAPSYLKNIIEAVAAL